jgi:uncharacterized protein (DUF885 family)
MREAEEKLGARFDQRLFHDAILAIGSVPCRSWSSA